MTEEINVLNFDSAKQSSISFETQAIAGKTYRYLKVYYKNSLVRQIEINKEVEYQSLVINIPNIDSADIQFEVSE